MATETKIGLDVKKVVAPKFKDPSTMTDEQLTDPDYRMKQLMKGNSGHPAICSQCHHCR